MVLCVLGMLAAPWTGGIADAQPRISVSQTADLDPAGQVVTVSGSGFDEAKGIYIAFCVVPPAGAAPSPCGGGGGPGGGDGGEANWISSNPPSYGAGLAVPYGPGGSFSVTVRVQALIPPEIDCRQVRCAIVTRADHVRSSDRSQDVIVPVAFRGDAPSPSSPPTSSPPTQPAPPPPPPSTTGDELAPGAASPAEGAPAEDPDLPTTEATSTSIDSADGDADQGDADQGTGDDQLDGEGDAAEGETVAARGDEAAAAADATSPGGGGSNSWIWVVVAAVGIGGAVAGVRISKRSRTESQA